MNPQPGGLTVTIDDHQTSVAVTGGATFTLPIGPRTLLDGPLEHADPRHPRISRARSASCTIISTT